MQEPTFLIMTALAGSPMHGYGVIQEVAALSEGRVKLRPGTLYGLDKSFRPFTYFQLLLPIFASAIVGGIGQPIGAVAGGFIVAYSEVMLTYAYKGVLTYLGFEPEGLVQMLGTDYKFAISFIILVIVLLIRPTGIFKGRTI